MATGLLTSVGLVPVQLQIVVAAAVFTHFLALGPLETLIVHFFALFFRGHIESGLPGVAVCERYLD